MLNFIKKPYRWMIICTAVVTIFFTYALIDTFVIPKNLQSVEQSNSLYQDTAKSETSSAANITATTYEDENIDITVETLRDYATTYYVATIKVTDPKYLKTALAQDTYGRNIEETTSDIAESNNAILAINGDYYGFRDRGYVLKNGKLYRDTSDSTDSLLINSEGDFSTINESSTDAQSLLDDGAWQVLSFGPTLISDGEIAVDSNTEVGKSMTSNPRTAIGQISELEYVFIVSDGRTEESEGLSLLELAEILKEQGCETAYNLDGGGSSTIYFNGEVINNPTSGRSIEEREVSDIVYIGY